MWYAAFPGVCNPDVAVDAVMGLEVFGEPLVCTKETLRHSCEFSGLVDDAPLNLVEDLLYVRCSTAVRSTLEVF